MKITIPRSKRPLKLKSVKISSKKIQSIIDQEVAEALEHFKDQESGGWRLDKSFIVNEVLYKIFGFLIGDEIDQAFINAGLTVSYDSDGSFVESKDGYKPIFFNEKTGKIKVVENTDDKDYLYKYISKKGWEQVGRL